MTLNYIILGLIFFAGLFLALASVFNSRILFGKPAEETEENEGSIKSKPVLNPLANFSRSMLNKSGSNSKRSAYFFLGLIIIVLGFVAIFFTDFLEKPITFE